MKIILEFNDDEIKQAEQAYRGADYAMAAEEFRNHLRLKLKHGDLKDEAQAAVQELSDDFHNIFAGLLDD